MNKSKTLDFYFRCLDETVLYVGKIIWENNFGREPLEKNSADYNLEYIFMTVVRINGM